ncbi:uncharacterized protein LOC109811051 isoform X1 [Cajanus cajan]|uniref:uncharacterized protein LOC109811051 isoform X1 n=1 Tax=Cajanus cajan TaxID=3821 RepID=UPI00098DB063|nr:uncharacterized protein LOC109811051 isoform X1 [Cajanus cajan]
MKESQTPQKTYVRSSVKRNRRLKYSPNFNKITSKSLNAALTFVSEAYEDSSPISEISYANRSEDDNLVDEITKYVIEDRYKNTVLEDIDRSYQVLTAKNRIVILFLHLVYRSIGYIFFSLPIFIALSVVHCQLEPLVELWYLIYI